MDALWRSFPAEAVRVDQASGRYPDPARLVPADSRGERIPTRGPLDVPGSPQGRPISV